MGSNGEFGMTLEYTGIRVMAVGLVALELFVTGDLIVKKHFTLQSLCCQLLVLVESSNSVDTLTIIA